MFLKVGLNVVHKRSVTFCVLRENVRKICSKPEIRSKDIDFKNEVKVLLDKYESKLLYNSFIENMRRKSGYTKGHEFKVKKYNKKLKDNLASLQPLPLVLKYVSDDSLNTNQTEMGEPDYLANEKCDVIETDKLDNYVYFPYRDDFHAIGQTNFKEKVCSDDKTNSIDYEIRQRYESSKNWMTAYDNFNDLETADEDEGWRINYGTADPQSKISNIPCGGCGALLHCKDTAIPGYIPAEIFKNSHKKGGANLESIICQRCFFLREYNLALQVKVSADDYPKVLTTIANERALVVVIVDLTDFPCSIWPGIADIFGRKTPIVVVGNKVDLLPSDGKGSLNRIKENLLNHMKLSGFAMSNILHVALLSAKTGFGVEDFITSLQSLWRHKGDVYLVGCTNVGKSSLFNALLQSDYCKIQASDLIQRATTSQWPGTTLNLLKFPIMRPSSYRLYLRHQRIKIVHQIEASERRLRKEQLKEQNNARYATLIGHIGQTYSKPLNEENEVKDGFTTRANANASGISKMGINQNHPDYSLSRWCFDTPGVLQTDQILPLLTTEELVYTLPKQLIKPETFCVKVGTTLFIGGIARLDYLEGSGSIRLTVFRSDSLPITVCQLEKAEQVYQDCIGTDLFQVPINEGDRLSKWPGLEPCPPFLITGSDRNTSCNDVVLSSAGWIAINCPPEKPHKFQAWTPEKRGIYVRDCVLPNAVNLRGRRIKFSVAYQNLKYV